ncbi:hypothetical protein KY348_00550 [Candidatus Woesearchaeota archaeon]|nr:hypothetical protein [Candidatus Woesearchaeota archaeon]
MEKKTASGNLPVKKFKAGAISATIWENQAQNKQGEEVTYNSVSFDRTYKDANGEWQKTNSLRTSDLPKAALVLNKAYEFLALNRPEAAEA